jgi:hypothetical protein
LLRAPAKPQAILPSEAVTYVVEPLGVSMRANTVDGALENLSGLLIATVPDPYDRQALGEAIDRYIAAREREGISG